MSNRHTLYLDKSIAGRFGAHFSHNRIHGFSRSSYGEFPGSSVFRRSGCSVLFLLEDYVVAWIAAY
jgi:hypothetical protein